jgi:hypothetical protein
VKIASNFKDFYDYVAWQYDGGDPTFLYLRHRSVDSRKVIARDDCPPGIDVEKTSRLKLYEYLFFCGDVYCVHEEKITHKIKAVSPCGDCFSCRITKNSKCANRNVLIVEDLKKIALKHNEPVFQYVWGCGEGEIWVPTLKDLHFDKVCGISPEMVYHRIEDYKRNVLTPVVEISGTNQSDKEKTVAHGFDVKQSFRHRKCCYNPKLNSQQRKLKMKDFQKFAKLVNEQFTKMSQHELFVVDNGEDNRWLETQYLKTFPVGSDPIYKKKTEHDCNCCKVFIRNVGNTVSLEGGLQTIWDIEGAPYPYDVVAHHMAELVRSRKIVDLFRTTEKKFGAQENYRNDPVDGVVAHNHFYATIAARHQVKGESVATATGKYRTNVATLERAVTELNIQAAYDVLDLIESNNLYRGAEHKHAVTEMVKVMQGYGKSKNKDQYLWLNANSPAAHFKNSSIGELVNDLSGGEFTMEQAVGRFEFKVAGANYKRPTALVTPKMVENAMKTIEKLGLESALNRRHAKISDVTVNNVLWVRNDTKKKMRSALEDTLMAATKKTKSVKVKDAGEVSIEEFMSGIMPTATSIEVLFESRLISSLMSITAPVEQNVEQLFQWKNNFGWSYNGNIADSLIKDKVGKAGGNITSAALRVSLAWNNYDDLDIHVTEPSGGIIYFGNKHGGRPGAKMLDVDMNISPNTRSPVENVSWLSSQLGDGVYEVSVHNFTYREDENVGCTVEVENCGKITQFSYNQRLKSKMHTPIVNFVVKNGVVTEMHPAKGVDSHGIQQDAWGLKTEEWVPVETIMFSPNHWDENAVGNKHHFFILKDCLNDQPARGIYNEFLRGDLNEHRKVFELVGDKTKCPVVDEQLSGLGFSSTKRESVSVKVDGRIYKVNF